MIKSSINYKHLFIPIVLLLCLLSIALPLLYVREMTLKNDYNAKALSMSEAVYPNAKVVKIDLFPNNQACSCIVSLRTKTGEIVYAAFFTIQGRMNESNFISLINSNGVIKFISSLYSTEVHPLARKLIDSKYYKPFYELFKEDPVPLNKESLKKEAADLISGATKSYEKLATTIEKVRELVLIYKGGLI